MSFKELEMDEYLCLEAQIGYFNLLIEKISKDIINPTQSTGINYLIDQATGYSKSKTIENTKTLISLMHQVVVCKKKLGDKSWKETNKTLSDIALIYDTEMKNEVSKIEPKLSPTLDALHSVFQERVADNKKAKKYIYNKWMSIGSVTKKMDIDREKVIENLNKLVGENLVSKKEFLGVIVYSPIYIEGYFDDGETEEHLIFIDTKN